MKIGIIGASEKAGRQVIEELFKAGDTIPKDTTFVLYAPHSTGKIKATLEELLTTAYSDGIDVSEKNFLATNHFEDLKGSDFYHLASSLFPNNEYIQKIAQENPALGLRDIMSWDNYHIIKDSCEKIKESKTKPNILIVTNQVDTFSSLAREWLGSRNYNIWGLGGSVDTARLKRHLSTYLNKKNITNNEKPIQSNNIQAFVGGYHNEFMLLFEKYFKIEGISEESLKKTPPKQLMQKTIAEGKRLIDLATDPRKESDNPSTYILPAKEVAHFICSYIGASEPYETIINRPFLPEEFQLSPLGAQLLSRVEKGKLTPFPMTFTEKEQVAFFYSNRANVSSFMSLRSGQNKTLSPSRWFAQKSFKEERVPTKYIKSLFPKNNRSAQND